MNPDGWLESLSHVKLQRYVTFLEATENVDRQIAGVVSISG
jgi:hypothetical protein